MELTSYGITCLDAELTEGQLAALYRNGRIELIYKHCKSLYVLITETDRLKESPAAMWKSLSLVQEDEVYFTSHFVSLPGVDQPNANVKNLLLDREKKDKTNEKTRLKKLQKLQQLAETDKTAEAQLLLQKQSTEPQDVPLKNMQAPISGAHDLLKPPLKAKKM